MEHAAFLDFLNVGSPEFSPFVVVNGHRVFPESVSRHPGTAPHLSCRYADGFSDDLYFVREPDGGLSCRRVFCNSSGDAIQLGELGIVLSGIRLGDDPAKDYFYHNENPRIYQRMTFPIDYCRTRADASDSEYDYSAGTRWADPGVVSERIGRSPYQPFPAIHLGNYESKHGLVHGTLAQKELYHNYLVSHDSGGVRLEIYSSFKALAYLDCAGDRTVTDEWWLGATEHADDLERIFEDYAAALRRKLPAGYGATSINRDSMVWGSWNDGISRNVSEDLVLQEADYLSRNFPVVRWIQLDDGYAVDGPPAHGLGVPYEGEDGIDRKKFPHGLRYLTDRIRELGLRPALWIGGLCAHKTKIYREHPDWFCDYGFRIPNQSPLDPSCPEAREYAGHALDVLLGEYNFDAVKHDFWSYAFEDSHDLLKNRTESGYHWRDWWLHELRRRLPTDGYLQTGCDIVMGNPFLGEYFTNYRYGIDIGSGHWDYVRTNFLWGIACFATHTGDLFVPNSDSVGLFPGLCETDALFALNYCLVTHSMVEIAGKLSLADPKNPRLCRLHKATCCVNNGQDVFFADYDYRSAPAPLPAVLYFRTPHFSVLEDNPCLAPRTVGLFNTEDEPRSVTFTAEGIGLSGHDFRALDIWTQETLTPEGGAFRVTLPPHGSRVLAILPEGQNLLEDADVCVTAARGETDAMYITFARAAQAELRFTRPVRSVCRDGVPVPFRADGGLCRLVLAEAGEYAFGF